jgi:hypothetical protein
MEILADILASTSDQLPGGAGAYLALRRRGSRGSPTWRRSRPRRSRPGSGPLGRLVPAARWIETARAAFQR